MLSFFNIKNMLKKNMLKKNKDCQSAIYKDKNRQSKTIC